MLPQDSYNRENLVHFRDVRVQGATVAFCLPQLLPAQLLLTPSGFLTFKYSAKSFHSWGTPASQWAWSTVTATACAGSAQAHRQARKRGDAFVTKQCLALPVRQHCHPWWLVEHLNKLLFPMKCCRLWIFCWRGRASSIFQWCAVI